jgi:hypothetical protein
LSDQSAHQFSLCYEIAISLAARVGCDSPWHEPALGFLYEPIVLDCAEASSHTLIGVESQKAMEQSRKVKAKDESKQVQGKSLQVKDLSETYLRPAPDWLETCPDFSFITLDSSFPSF